jgi:hypothetical protein
MRGHSQSPTDLSWFMIIMIGMTEVVVGCVGFKLETSGI